LRKNNSVKPIFYQLFKNPPSTNHHLTSVSTSI